MSKEILQQASNLLGENVTIECLLRLTAHLKNGAAETQEDVVGFTHLVRYDSTCYEFYAANPPLIGLTQPVPVPCPLGIACIEQYNIDYQEAVRIYHTVTDEKFTSLILSKPLTSEVTEPYWYFQSICDQTIIIGAISGRVY